MLPARAVEPVGLLLLLKAFSAGCSALTGVEAIANGVPLFKPPRVRRAKRTELLLGVILGAMLLGVATLAGRCSRWRPTPPSAACRCWPACWRGTLLVAVGGNTLTLIPLYAIGVFTGFTLSQGGLVVHWRRTRPPRWRYRASLNGLGAAVTAVATVVFLATKFTEGAWAVVLGFARVHHAVHQDPPLLRPGRARPRHRRNPRQAPRQAGRGRGARDRGVEARPVRDFGGAVYQRARGGGHSRPQRRGRGIRASS